jgi:hypothetical protein
MGLHGLLFERIYKLPRNDLALWKCTGISDADCRWFAEFHFTARNVIIKKLFTLLLQ